MLRAVAHPTHIILSVYGDYFCEVRRYFQVETARKRGVEFTHECPMGTQLRGTGITAAHVLLKRRTSRRLQFVVNERRDLIALTNIIVGNHQRKLNSGNATLQKLLAHHLARAK